MTRTDEIIAELDALLTRRDDDHTTAVDPDDVRKGAWFWTGSRWRPVTGWERWGRTYVIQSGTETVARLNIDTDAAIIHTDPRGMTDAVAVLKIKLSRS